MSIEDLRDLLRGNMVTVLFTKKDGSLREMICTTMEEYIPPVSGTSIPRDDIVTVWDLENEGWRSFRYESVISANVE